MLVIVDDIEVEDPEGYQRHNKADHHEDDGAIEALRPLSKVPPSSHQAVVHHHTGCVGLDRDEAVVEDEGLGQTKVPVSVRTPRLPPIHEKANLYDQKGDGQHKAERTEEDVMAGPLICRKQKYGQKDGDPGQNMESIKRQSYRDAEKHRSGGPTVKLELLEKKLKEASPTIGRA